LLVDFPEYGFNGIQVLDQDFLEGDIPNNGFNVVVNENLSVGLGNEPFFPAAVVGYEHAGDDAVYIPGSIEIVVLDTNLVTVYNPLVMEKEMSKGLNLPIESRIRFGVSNEIKDDKPQDQASRFLKFAINGTFQDRDSAYIELGVRIFDHFKNPILSFDRDLPMLSLNARIPLYGLKPGQYDLHLEWDGRTPYIHHQVFQISEGK